MQKYEQLGTPTRVQPTKDQLSRWQAQEKILFEFFHKQPATMFMAETATGIMRPNICRAVGKWKKAGTIRIIKTDIDPLTKCRAQFLSTNSRHWQPLQPAGKQVSMFE